MNRMMTDHLTWLKADGVISLAVQILLSHLLTIKEVVYKTMGHYKKRAF